MSNEVIWKKIPNFENYSISEYGEIRNDISGRILHQYSRPDGRLMIFLSNDNYKRKCFYVHRLMIDIFKEDNKGRYVRHIDGNKSNNAISNLEPYNESNGGKGKARMKRERRVIDISTGDIYESIRKCVLAIGGTNPGVWCCLNGYTKTYKGHVFRYLD